MDKPKKKSKGDIFNLDIGNIKIKNPFENFKPELI
jgi:hypothetical protein